jgi:hypothetical protein
MNTGMPKIDSRGAKQIYEKAVELAGVYCPEWKPDGDDYGSAFLKLFARLAEIVIGQLNRVPEKHLLALYDFIGMDYLPAAAAQVPLTFKLAEGGREALVPARTRAASSEDPEVVFETLEPLTVVNLKIKSAYSLNPWEDKFTNHGMEIDGWEKGFRILGGDEAEKPVEHLLYLADEAFDYQNPAGLTFTFSFNNYAEAFKDYFGGCADGTGVELNPEIMTDHSGHKVIFKFPRLVLPKAVIQDRKNNWISFGPRLTLPLGPDAVLPGVSNISCDFTASGITPDQVLVNDAPADLKKGFYPFGETPKVGDALYIGCEDAFSRLEPAREAVVELNFTIKGGVESGNLGLAWEYWDGGKWSRLDIKSDTTNRFLRSPETEEFTGSLKFTCPGIADTVLNDIATKWIRARIILGGYGEPGHYKEVAFDDILKTAYGAREEIIDSIPRSIIDDKARFKNENNEFLKKYHLELLRRLGEKGIGSGFVYQPPNFIPPLITSLSIGYSFTKNKLQQGIACNNREYREVNLGESFQPFSQAGEKPAFFLGFEANLANQPVALYFSLKPGLCNDTVTKINEPGYNGKFDFGEKAGGLLWKYAAAPDGKWADLVVVDGTDGLLQSGVCKFVIPGDIAKHTLFGENLYWLKVVLKDGAWTEPPVLKGVFPNTVQAENTMVKKDELLGSSNDRPDQVFHFAVKSLLEKPVIEVRETSIPSEDELKMITAEAGGDPLRLIKNESGDPVEIWVRWHEVKTFGHSNSLSRHYLIDRINGWIRFGDGVRGMIPPALTDNVFAREYQSGGGKKGNQRPKVITELKTTIPQIEGVTNHDAASGGRELELMEDLLYRAPYALKTGSRAVTLEDFEWLAREASTQVFKAKCIGGSNGEIRVIIAPADEKGGLSPEMSLIDWVKSYLKEKAFAPIRDRIEVSGPDYQKINLYITIKPFSISEGPVIKEKISRRLELFFNLVRGGPEGKGWDFGEDLYLSDVAAIVEGVEGIDCITDLKIIKKAGDKEEQALIDSDARGKTWLALNHNELICLGTMEINLTGGKV